jgi:hypothetical protein
MENLIGGSGVVVVWAGTLPGLVGLADLLGKVRGGGGGGGRDVRDVGALAVEVAGEEDEGDGAPEDRGEEWHGERGRDLHRRRRHLLPRCCWLAGEGEGEGVWNWICVFFARQLKTAGVCCGPYTPTFYFGPSPARSGMQSWPSPTRENNLGCEAFFKP